MSKSHEQPTVMVEVVHDSVPPHGFKGDVLPAATFGEELTRLIEAGALAYADPNYRPPATAGEQLKLAKADAASFAAQRDQFQAEAADLRRQLASATANIKGLEDQLAVANAKPKK